MEIYERVVSTFGQATVTIGLLIWFILTIVANWKLFEKAGKAGILSIIPFYNVFVLMKILNGKAWTALLYLIPPVAFAYGIINSLRMAVCYNKSILVGVLGIFFNPIMRIYLAFSEDAKYIGPRTLRGLFSKIDNEV